MIYDQFSYVDIAEMIWRRDGKLPLDIAAELFTQGYDVTRLEEKWARARDNETNQKDTDTTHG